MGAPPAHDTHEAPDATFNRSFPAEERGELMQEDSQAWEAVTGLLLTIVTIGVAFFALIVYLISY